MLRELNKTDMERILASQYHAHLACCNGQEPYIVPISYVFHENALLGYTHAGRKIEILRKNPRACVQVDKIDEDQWLSVIVYGQYEEMKGKDCVRAIDLLGEKIRSPHKNHSPFLREELIEHSETRESKAIIYRINITSMTGRIFGMPYVDV